jgi:hypothetical protein
MQTKLVHLAFVAALAFILGMAVSARGNPFGSLPDSMDALTAAPKNHRVLYEDDHVRVIEVTVQPGETENLHTHKYASVFIYDAAQPKLKNHLADGTSWEYGRNFERISKSFEGVPMPSQVQTAMARREADLPAALSMGWPAAMAMGPDSGQAHQVSNLDTFPLHFYRFEFKRIDGDSIMKRTSY